MKKYIIASVIALALVVGAFASSADAATFTRDLRVGSTGADVTALQSFLISKGLLNVAAPTGYFGNMTKTAVAAYQTSKGITPAAGYFGPTTTGVVVAEMAGGSVSTATPGCPAGAKFNSTTGAPCGTTSTVPGCAAGSMFSSTTGAKCDGSTTNATVTTVGVEGTLSITQTSAGVSTTVYEADSMAPVLAFKAEAKDSDINVQRVKLDLGTDTKIYNKIYQKVYITEGSTVLASSDLNSSTVTKDGTRYYITLAGFNSVIAKGSNKVYMVKVDVRPSIDSSDIDTETYTIRLASSGVRGSDGAGIDQYAGDTSVSKTISVSSDLADSSTLTVSLNPATPKKGDVVATSGSNENELDGLSVLNFDVKAEKDNVKITDLNIAIAKTGTGAATASTTVHLFDGSTELDNASISGDTAVFSDLDLDIAKNQTKTLTVKIDVRNANGTDARFTATASSSGITAENSRGDTTTVSGSATGYSIGVRNVGPEVTLLSKNIVVDGAPQTSGANNIATSSLTATFSVQVKAVGGALMFGTAGSTTPMFTSTPTSFKVYRNGAEYTTISSYATSTSFSTPSGVTTSGASFTVAEGQTVTVPVTFKILGRSASAPLTDGLYSVELEGIQPNATYASTFMAGEADWRTSDISFP